MHYQEELLDQFPELSRPVSPGQVMIFLDQTDRSIIDSPVLPHVEHSHGDCILALPDEEGRGKSVRSQVQPLGTEIGPPQ